MLAILRGVLREAQQLGQISAEEFQQIASIEAVRGTDPPEGQVLSKDDLAALFLACQAEDSNLSRRDAAILAMLYGCGLRRTEVVDLDLADYDSATGIVSVHARKGKKAGQRYTVSGQADLIKSWLEMRGDAEGPLFCPVLRSGRIRLRRLSASTVPHIVERCAVRARIVHFSSRVLRRTMIDNLLTAGADIRQVPKWPDMPVCKPPRAMISA